MYKQERKGGGRGKHALNLISAILVSFNSSFSHPLQTTIPLIFFSVADGGGRISRGQDKLLNIQISNGSSWKLLTDAGHEITRGEAAKVRLMASHWFLLFIVKSKSMVGLQAKTVSHFLSLFPLDSPHSSLFSSSGFPFASLLRPLLSLLFLCSLPLPLSIFRSPCFIPLLSYQNMRRPAWLVMSKSKAPDFDWCSKFFFT